LGNCSSCNFIYIARINFNTKGHKISLLNNNLINNSMRRKIAIFTGNRAEYGLQFPIIKAINENENLIYNLIVSGSHLEKKYGNTIQQILKDKLKIKARIKLISYDNRIKTYTSLIISEAIKKISLILNKIKPDLMLVSTDRYETFAAAVASTQMNIPTCHVEGGDITQGGTFDDSIRHAITKLSHIHFATNKMSYKNILKLGEEKWRVFNTGLPINDTILSFKKESANNLEKLFNINFYKPLIIFTYHPVAVDIKLIKKYMATSLKALDHLMKYNSCQIIVTYPNNDYGSEFIIQSLKKFARKYIKNFKLVKVLSSYYLHSIIYHGNCGNFAIVGNSSLGIKEAIAFKCPVVNIGSRQDGRLKPGNVLDVENNLNKIIITTKKALFDKQFKKNCLGEINPYYKKDSGKKIAKILSELKINKKLLKKKILL